MMSKNAEKWRVVRAAFAATSASNDWKREVGESAATIWLDKNGWNYVALNTKIDDKPASLAALGGKRPDFCAEIKGELVYLDAKYHKCANDEFYLEEKEIAQYVKLREWLIKEGDSGERDIVFMVFPHRHTATQLVFVHLDELIHGQAFVTAEGNSARKVSLLDRDNLTFEVSLI
ncbi:hypothetical protein Q4S45_20640 [Massilia sp. R2A-15]|uniref:hypothetical protein n=1 Tax=Massilia sp. R2A-15 TaxID=3064278 RepID=UPI0027359FCD|nr:hypothetical protein [Massilia sp. R2A-15]WLI89081.1 hypothetical protein Q4S45_20640 [Massilia sp. R2A-15]